MRLLVGVVVGLGGAVAYAVWLVARHDEALRRKENVPSRRLWWSLQTLSVVGPLYVM
jgi:hypothetical protein